MAVFVIGDLHRGLDIQNLEGLKPNAIRGVGITRSQGSAPMSIVLSTTLITLLRLRGSRKAVVFRFKELWLDCSNDGKVQEQRIGEL